MSRSSSPNSAALVVAAVVLVALGLILLFMFRGTSPAEVKGTGTPVAPPVNPLSPSGEPRPTAQAPATPVNPNTPADEADIHIAASEGDIAQLQQVLAGSAGTDPDAPAAGGRTPLMLAAENGHADAIRVLLSHGANPDAQDEAGVNALMLAAMRNHTDAAAVLIEAGGSGTDLDVTDADGNTALIWAGRSGGPEMVVLLLDHGASPRIRNAAGATAYDLARLRSDEQGRSAAEILEQAN